MTSSKRAFFLTLGLCLAALLPARAVAQQPPAHEPTPQELETARSLYKEGKELRAAGDLSGAIEKLQAAHALGNTPVTGMELARAFEAAGKLVEAREVALSIAHIPVASDEREKSAEARVDAAKLADDLRTRIPTLRARVTGLASGEPAHLSIDGAGVPDVALAEPQKVDPGKHVLVLHAGEAETAREARAEVSVVEGRSVEVLLEVPPARSTAQPTPAPLAPPPAAPSQVGPVPAEAPKHRSMPTLAKVGFGVGAAAAAAGLITGFMALEDKNSLAGECPVNNECQKGTPGANDLDAARTSATISTVSFCVAGAGFALGIVTLLTDHPAAASQTSGKIVPWLGPGAAGIHGSF
ncbi:MAG TPA: hypothetical protein VF765_26365 [Polyangiaceae bacterium]